MTIVVEDGTGLSTAESYASVADANTYFAKRLNAAWDELDDIDDKEPALIKATDFMERVYGQKWIGTRTSETQALSFPREGVKRVGGWNYYDNDEIPREVKVACMELALKVSSEPLAADLTADDFIEAVTIGPISINYKESSPAVKIYREINDLLAPLFGGIASSGMAVKVIRT